MVLPVDGSKGNNCPRNGVHGGGVNNVHSILSFLGDFN